jgi:multiple sugar transport system permease protein
MEFIAHMVSRASQLRYGQHSNQLPANRTATEAPFYADDPQWRLLVGEMAHSRHRPVTPVGTLMWQELARAWETGGGDGVAPAEALARAQRSVQAELDRMAGKEALPLVNWALAWALVGGAILGAVGLRAASSWRKLRGGSLHRNEAVAGYLFSLPATVGLLVLWIGPVVVILVYSFSVYDILNPARWTGLGNYRRLLLDDPLFWKSLWNTLYFVVFATPTAVAGALGLALLLNQEIRGRSVWRALFYLPSLVPLVALSLLFLWLLNAQNGLFNLVLESIGLPRVPWLTSPSFSKPSLLIMNLFTVGAGMVIFLAGLQGVPRHLHEAAMIDGAGVLQRFRNVTLPSLMPTIFFMMVINTIMSFQVFTQAFLMTSTSSPGAPEDSLMFYVFYLFIQGFVNFNMGYASAMAWILFVIIVAVTLVQHRVALRLGYEDVMR